jgi:membrane protein YdbS with pleckstrin-like domain
VKKPIVWVAAVLLLLFAFSVLIYPTPYRYLEFEYENNGGRVPVRLNVITGKTETFTPMFGWTTIRNQEQ